MTSWMYLLLAFALGWLIGFLIDWWYWRRNGTRLQASLEASQADSAKLRTDLDGTRQQMAGVTTDLQSARADNDHLRLQLTKGSQGLVVPGLAAAAGAAVGAAVASDEDVEAYKRQIADLEAKVVMLQNDLNATRDDRWRLRDEAVASESDEATLRAENERLQAEMLELKGQGIEAYKLRIEELEAQVNGCHSDVQAGRLEVAHLQTEMKKLVAVGAAGAAVAGGVQAVAGDEQDVEEHKQRIADLEAQPEEESGVSPAAAAAGAGAVAGAMYTTEDVEAYQRQIAELEAQVEGLQKELDTSAGRETAAPAVAAGAAVGAEVSKAEDVEPYKRQIADLEAEVADLQKQLASATESSSRVDKPGLMGATVGAVAGMMHKSEDAEAYEKQIADLQAQVEGLQKELEASSAGREGVSPALAAGAGAVVGAAAASGGEDVEASKQRIADLEAQLDACQSDLATAQAEAVRLQGEAKLPPAAAMAAGATLGAMASGSGDEVDEYKQRIADLEAQLDACQSDLATAQAEAARLQGETRMPPAAAMAAGATLGAMASGSGDEVDEYKRRNADLEAQLNACQSDLASGQAEAARLQRELKALAAAGAVGATAAAAQTLTSEETPPPPPPVAAQTLTSEATPPPLPPVAAGATLGVVAAGKAAEEARPAGSAPTGDDLAMIEGIGPRIAELLAAGGITTFAQLAATPQSELEAILDKGGPAFNRADPETWPEQAALAARGDTEGLTKLQAQLIGGRRLKADDLALIEGIGPKTAELLRANGIISFRQLAAADPAQLKTILAKGGPAFNYADPGTWPEQAALLAQGDTARFNALTAELIAGRRRADNLAALHGVSPALAAALGAHGIKSYKQLADTDRASLEAAMAEAGSPSNGMEYDALSEQATLAAAGDWDVLKEYQDRLVADASAPADDLGEIEGIGSKINQVLNAAGIRTFWRLWHTTPQTLRAILAAAGSQYRIADPTSWPEQAALLAKGDRAAFDALTARLVGGREPGAGTVAEAAERPADDLTRIRGIGPSIAKALNAAGITTYENLAAQTPERLREIATPIAGPNVEVQVWIIRARELSNDPSRRQS